MLDPKLLRTNLDDVARQLARRGYHLDTQALTTIEEKRKRVQVIAQQFQQDRNAKSKAIGIAKSRGEDTAKLMKEVSDTGAALKQAEEELEQIQSELTEIALGIPNIPHVSVPDGKDENDNKELRRWGEPRQFGFTPKDHVDIGAALGMMDFDSAARITGARFVVMNGPLARLHRALIQFMLDLHTQEHGYTETYVPYMVNADSLRGTGQLPPPPRPPGHLAPRPVGRALLKEGLDALARIVGQRDQGDHLTQVPERGAVLHPRHGRGGLLGETQRRRRKAGERPRQRVHGRREIGPRHETAHQPHLVGLARADLLAREDHEHAALASDAAEDGRHDDERQEADLDLG